jgi:hypothetical protein
MSIRSSGRDRFLRWRVGSKQVADESNAFRTVSVGQVSKLADADEAVWENVLHVTSQELRC